jgi:PAS domain S-box-containing protein
MLHAIKNVGLKTKLTGAVSLLVVCIMLLTAFGTRQYFKKHFQETITRQQFSLISVIADDIDARLASSLQTIIDIASLVTPDMLENPVTARKFLDRQHQATRIFDNGIFLFNRSGIMVAEFPLAPRTGQDFSYREYFRTTVATRKPYISKPYLSSQEHHHPAVMFTAPVFDRAGNLIGVLAGSIDLNKHGILAKITDIKIGKTGYLYLYNTDRTLILHPDTTRILKQDVPPGVNRMFDAAIAGFEGTAENVNSRGLMSLSSFKRLKATDWIIAANYPVHEAYAAVYRAEKYIALSLIPAIAVILLIIHLLMNRLMAPLVQFIRHVEELPHRGEGWKLLSIASRDEIGALAQAFNTMAEELGQQERILREQLHFLQTLIDTIPAPIFYKDATGRYLGCNTAFQTYLGRPKEEIVGSTVFDVAPAELAQIYLDADQSLLQHPGLQCYEASIFFADGTLRDVMFYKATFANADGTIGGLVGTLLDITDRNRAEESLRKLSHAVEQSPASVIITDTAGTIEYVNPKFTEVTGYGAEEAIGRNPRFLTSGEMSREEYEHLWQTIRNGREWRGEFHNRKKSGELYWELASISPIRDTEGRITHFLAVKEDITERRTLENQLRHSQKMDAIGQLAGGIAHDFNNILTAIIGYASSLLMKADADPRLTNVLDQIIAAAERGAGLTQGLLSFSRKQVTNPKAVNLNDIVRRMEKLLARLIGEDIELNTVLSPESPIIMADSMQIEQVLMNLTTNGRDAMPDGGRLTIRTGLINLDNKFALTHGYGSPGIYALIEVSDEGSGMDEETVKRIFEPFYSTKEVGKGTGLGLSIVYGIIKKHNGYINCYSEPGKGSVFTIYLPAIRETADLPYTPPQPRLAGGTETILLAEDDAAVRKITRDLLEEHGYRVIEAVDGEDALARFRKHWEEVHLLMLDVIMPKLNGKEVYDEISRMRPDIKVIFTSGYSAEIVQQKGMLDEGTICLPKPISQQVLLARIREVLNHA